MRFHLSLPGNGFERHVRYTWAVSRRHFSVQALIVFPKFSTMITVHEARLCQTLRCQHPMLQLLYVKYPKLVGLKGSFGERAHLAALALAATLAAFAAPAAPAALASTCASSHLGRLETT